MIPATPTRGVIVRNPWARNVLTFLMVFGPGLIVMEADNDAGAVSTYIQAGAQYGTHLLWLLVLLLPITYFIQEMVVRLGIATGRGHAAMIYQRFGKWWGRFSLVDLELVNFMTLVTEFAAIALALQTPGRIAVSCRCSVLRRGAHRSWCSPEAICAGSGSRCSSACSTWPGWRSPFDRTRPSGRSREHLRSPISRPEV